jgi:hypothetical protein
VKRLFAAVHPQSVMTSDGGVRPQPIRDEDWAVHPQLVTAQGGTLHLRPMSAEDWTAIQQRRRRLRHRLRLRLLGVGRAGWIAVGVLVMLWTVGTLL